MNVEIINTGSELMLGRVVNTHQAWLGSRLAEIGLRVTRQTSVDDAGPMMLEVLAESLRRAGLVVVTGGLGPTSDDLTRQRVAELLGRRLVEDPDARAQIEGYFSARQRPMPVSVLSQALVPEGATVLANRNGTAPGLALEVEPGRFSPQGSFLVMLPGPPRELHPMFESSVLPLLRSRFPSRAPFHSLTVRICGLGESWVEEQLAPFLPPLAERGLEVGYCARVGEVDVRLVASGEDGASLIAEAEKVVRSRLGDAVFGTGEETLEGRVVQLAAERGVRLAVAESCTGGCLAHRITNIPGASSVFWGAWVTYDNAAKETQLGVDPAILREHGAVSEACAAAMAEGALKRSGADHAVALTGIAGPAGGSEDKPVGTLFIGLASSGVGTVVRKYVNPFDRETFKWLSAQQALDLLRRRLLAVTPAPGR